MAVSRRRGAAAGQQHQQQQQQQQQRGGGGHHAGGWALVSSAAASSPYTKSTLQFKNLALGPTALPTVPTGVSTSHFWAFVAHI